MKKVILTAVFAVAGMAGAMAQGAQGEPCTGCTADRFDYCQSKVTVSLANTLKMNCDNCDDMHACANSITDWANGITLGEAQFSIAATDDYDVYMGSTTNNMPKVGGSGSLPLSILKAKVTSNLLGAPSAIVGTYGVSGPVTTRSGYTAGTAGAKIIQNAPPTLITKTAKVAFSTGPLPINTPNGDYAVNIVFAAILQ